jgi:replication initiation protein RepC
MTLKCALGAQRGRFAVAPTGFRRLTRSLVQADRLAAQFNGLPEGVAAYGQLLAAFKAAAPRLGLTHLVYAIDWLFKFTRPQDWGREARPVVWASASIQRETFGRSSTQVKALNRALIDAGLITMKDSPNGKRYGCRDDQGRIKEAYGFDLSPLAARYPEFMLLAKEAKAERAEMGRLRRRATIARNGIAQILETAAEYGLAAEEWQSLVRESRSLTRGLRRIERVDEMTFGVESLERRKVAARERLENLLAAAAPVAPDPVSSDPKGPENRPHQYSYKPSPYPEQDTVIASNRGKSDRAEDEAEPETPARPNEPQAGASRAAGGTVIELSTDELMHLAPRLRAYLKTPTPTWPEIVDAADWLRGELGVSKSLWGDACQAMGRKTATIAIAIVSAKPAAHFRSTPGAYFHGMVAKARSGELNLARTVWGLRLAAAQKSSR